MLAAYELLTAEGYLVSRGGAGTFVAAAARARRPDPLAGSATSERRPPSVTAEVLLNAHLPKL